MILAVKETLRMPGAQEMAWCVKCTGWGPEFRFQHPCKSQAFLGSPSIRESEMGGYLGLTSQSSELQFQLETLSQ